MSLGGHLRAGRLPAWSHGDAIVVYSGREAWGRHASRRPWGSGETTSPGRRASRPDRPGLHASCLQFIRDTDCAVLVWDMMDAFPNGVGVRWSVHAAIYALAAWPSWTMPSSSR